MHTDGSLKFNCGYCEKKNCSFDMVKGHIKSNPAVCHGIMGPRKSMIPRKVFSARTVVNSFHQRIF